MRVLRGRAATVETDRTVTRTLCADAAETGERAVRAWTPHRQVAFGRRDAGAPGYERARAAAEERRFEAHVRPVGGRAVAYTGTTVAFARVEPIEDLREGLAARYDAMTRDVKRALATLGVDAAEGEPPDSFCPGAHSLRAGGKVVGIAQRVRRGAALTAGICVTDDRAAVADVLDPVYDALGVPFDPESVGSVVRAAGRPVEPTEVVEALEAALVGDAATRVERVR
ncbi:lipoate--protein ligase family protein [Halomarina halobia]|uniref:Lipoate--protein ligase family protein n=1 Tax=Halomarina halobia TaxID=3033386 RepID=A0ABD6A9T7_9EURY|nr:lipoate--protein ligase family protein [Halomarina sp. PSR21]